MPNPPDLPQISAAAEAQCGGKGARDYDLPEAYHINESIPELKGGLVLKKCDAERARKIDLLFLSVGGNDIGFARLVANAVLADKSILRRLGGWFGHVHGFAEAGSQLDALDDRLKSVNRALHNLLHVPWSESDRVILTAYPPMALLDDGKSVCPDGHSGMTVLPEFALSEAKAREGNTRGGAAQRHHAGKRPPASVVVRRCASRHLPRPRPVRGLRRIRPGPWPTSCASRARSTAPGSPSIRRNGAPTPRASASSARPTTRS